MIVFDVRCRDSGDVFEAWFRSGADFDDQSARGLVRCPVCRSTRIEKAPMAPNIPSKSSGDPLPIERLAKLQSKLLENSEWVGDRFAQEALAIHLGEAEARAIHGNASGPDVRALVDEGVPVAALPIPLVPHDQVN